MTRVMVAQELASCWNDAQLRYAVLHGVEEFPDRIGRDLDILVHPDDMAPIADLTWRTLQSRGWDIAEPPGTWGTRLVAFKEDEGIEFHFVTELEWREIRLASTPTVDHWIANFPIDLWASFAKQVLMPGFRGETGRAAMSLKRLQEVPAATNAIEARLNQLLDRPNDGNVPVELGFETEMFLDSLPSLRREMARSAWRRAPGSVLITLGSKVIKRTESLVKPTGIVVAIWGETRQRTREIINELHSLETSVFTGFEFLEGPVARPKAKSHSTLSLLVAYLRQLVMQVALEPRLTRAQKVVFYTGHFCELVARHTLPTQRAALPRAVAWTSKLGPKPDLMIYLKHQPGPTQTAYEDAIAPAPSSYVELDEDHPAIALKVRKQVESAFLRKYASRRRRSG